MRKRTFLLAAALAAVPALAPATGGPATNMIMAHGNMCMPATNDLTRNSFGIRNNTTGNRAVYCGFQVREGASASFEVLFLALRNYGQTNRVVACNWRSGDPYSGYSTLAMNIEVAADAQPHSLTGYELSRPSANSSLNLYCVLPPGVSLEHIEAYGADVPTE